MADIKSLQFNKPTFNGTYNNASISATPVQGRALRNLQANDSIILREFPVGTTFHEYLIFGDNIGSGFTGTVLIRGFDGSSHYFNNVVETVNSSSAIKKTFMPFTVPESWRGATLQISVQSVISAPNSGLMNLSVVHTNPGF